MGVIQTQHIFAKGAAKISPINRAAPQRSVARELPGSSDQVFHADRRIVHIKH
jgi:hypothetical protein